MKLLSPKLIIALLLGTQIFLCSLSAQESKPVKPRQDCPEVELSPTEVFHSFYETAKEIDPERMKKLLTKETLFEMEMEAKQKNKTLEEFLRTESQIGLPATMPAVRNEKITGNKATLEMLREKPTIWLKVSFVKEDGCWKLSFI